jgi:hypothetical protein
MSPRRDQPARAQKPGRRRPLWVVRSHFARQQTMVLLSNPSNGIFDAFRSISLIDSSFVMGTLHLDFFIGTVLRLSPSCHRDFSLCIPKIFALKRSEHRDDFNGTATFLFSRVGNLREALDH